MAGWGPGGGAVKNTDSMVPKVEILIQKGWGVALESVFPTSYLGNFDPLIRAWKWLL